MALILLRHGESTANVEREKAESSGLEQIPVEARDADVPLSTLGVQQARASGVYLRELVSDLDRLQVWSSPYVRARQTARLALASAGFEVPITSDERLRDRELGILDTYTSAGIRNRFPEEAARRAWLGKFYYRPPGGESWADLALRLRSVLPELTREDADVCVFTHDAVVAVLRYILEGMDEAGILDLARRNPIGNAAVSRFASVGDQGPWVVQAYNDQTHLVGPDGADLRTLHPGEPDAHPR